MAEPAFFYTEIKLADSRAGQGFCKAVKSPQLWIRVVVSQGEGNMFMLPGADIQLFITTVELGSAVTPTNAFKIPDGQNHYTFSLCIDLLACKD